MAESLPAVASLDRKDAVIRQWPDVVKTHVRQPKTALQKSVRKDGF